MCKRDESIYEATIITFAISIFIRAVKMLIFDSIRDNYKKNVRIIGQLVEK